MILQVMAALALAQTSGSGGIQGKTGTLTLTVRETAGIRRFNYPVAVKLQLPRRVLRKDRFRLLSADRPVPAQFRPLEDERRGVMLDFEVNLGPLEIATYRVEYGPGVKSVPEPSQGLLLQEEKVGYTVRSGKMSYGVGTIQPSFLNTVREGTREFLDIPLLLSRLGKDGKLEPLVWQPVQVTRRGPLAVGFRYPLALGLMKSGVVGTVELTFPRSKSWAEFVVTLEPEATGVQMITLLKLGEGPTLVDFGAGSLVYTTLAQQQMASFQAGRSGRPVWEVLTGEAAVGPRDSPRLRPLVTALSGKHATRPEGWVHVMDRSRCTAIAVAGFGTEGEDLIEAEGTGLVKLRRTLARPGKKLSYRFWMHFVGMPVQVGAVTSPQSMLAPLAVEVK